MRESGENGVRKNVELNLLHIRVSFKSAMCVRDELGQMFLKQPGFSINYESSNCCPRGSKWLMPLPVNAG